MSDETLQSHEPPQSREMPGRGSLWRYRLFVGLGLAPLLTALLILNGPAQRAERHFTQPPTKNVVRAGFPWRFYERTVEPAGRPVRRCRFGAADR